MELRPASFSDNLNTWFRTLAKEWKPLLFASAAVFAVLGVLTVLVFLWNDFGSTFASFSDLASFETEPDLESMTDIYLDLGRAMLPWIALVSVGTVMVYLTSARIIGAHLAGRAAGWREALSFGWSRFWPALGASLIVTLGYLAAMGMTVVIIIWIISSWGANLVTVFLAAALFLTALVVSVWAGIKLSLFIPPIAFEDQAALASLRRSFNLTTGSWWPTFGFLSVSALIATVAAQILGIVVAPLFVGGLFEPALLAVAYGATTILQGPTAAAIGAAYAIWYLELRAREHPFNSDELL